MATPKSPAQLRQLTVKEIENLHSEILDSAKSCLEKAIQIGELLKPIRDSFPPRSGWIEWVKGNLTFSDRMASNYVRCFENRERLISETVSDIRSALKFLQEQPDNVPLSKPLPLPKPPVVQRVTTPKPPTPKPALPPAQPPVRKPAAAPTFAPEKQKDATGYILPDNLLPLWSRAQDVQDLLTYISNVRSRLKDAQESNDTLYADVNFSDVQSALNNAYASLKIAKPYAVCPSCKGKEMLVDGCTDCKCKGLVSEWFWMNCIPIEIREMRKEVLNDN